MYQSQKYSGERLVSITNLWDNAQSCIVGRFGGIVILFASQEYQSTNNSCESRATLILKHWKNTLWIATK